MTNDNISKLDDLIIQLQTDITKAKKDIEVKKTSANKGLQKAFDDYDALEEYNTKQTSKMLDKNEDIQIKDAHNVEYRRKAINQTELDYLIRHNKIEDMLSNLNFSSSLQLDVLHLRKLENYLDGVIKVRSLFLTIDFEHFACKLETISTKSKRVYPTLNLAPKNRNMELIMRCLCPTIEKPLVVYGKGVTYNYNPHISEYHFLLDNVEHSIDTQNNRLRAEGLPELSSVEAKEIIDAAKNMSLEEYMSLIKNYVATNTMLSFKLLK